MEWEKTHTHKQRRHGTEQEYLHEKKNWEVKKRISRVEETMNCPTNDWR